MRYVLSGFNPSSGITPFRTNLAQIHSQGKILVSIPLQGLPPFGLLNLLLWGFPYNLSFNPSSGITPFRTRRRACEPFFGFEFQSLFRDYPLSDLWEKGGLEAY